MRGQASIEFLVVAAAVLAILGMWVTVANAVNHDLNTAFEMQVARISTNRLVNGIRAVWLMGSGNSQLIEVFFLSNTSIVINQDMAISTDSFNYSHTLPITTNSSYFSISGKSALQIYNDNGVVTVTFKY